MEIPQEEQHSEAEKEKEKCICDEPATTQCVFCRRNLCDDINCGTDTVDGYLCGTYTQWGCARKYTNCDECMNDKAIHEEDFILCDECSEARCEECSKVFKECEFCSVKQCEPCASENFTVCDKCNNCDKNRCANCTETHVC